MSLQHFVVISSACVLFTASSPALSPPYSLFSPWCNPLPCSSHQGALLLSAPSWFSVLLLVGRWNQLPVHKEVLGHTFTPRSGSPLQSKWFCSLLAPAVSERSKPDPRKRKWRHETILFWCHRPQEPRPRVLWESQSRCWRDKQISRAPSVGGRDRNRL